jgi:CRP-like cAMP-binding protein
MNYNEILKSAFDVYFNTPVEAWDQFVEFSEFVSYEKDEVIKKQNTTERYFNFILKGSTGVFLWKENNFVCLDFAFNHQFSSDYMSYFTNMPTPLQVVALEDCEMLRMTVTNFKTLTESAIGNTIRIIAAESAYASKQQQQIELLTKKAFERYEILLKKFPDIYNRVAQNHIASYLGITPQSLSRIRRQVN